MFSERLYQKRFPLHTYRCVYVYSALFHVLNIYQQRKMHKQDRITYKTYKKNKIHCNL